MKIAIVSNTSWYLLNFRSGIIRALVEEGHDVFAIAPEDEYVPRLKELGLNYIPVYIDNKGMNPFLDIRTFFNFFSIYKNNKFDIVYHFTIKPVIYGGLSARLLSIPYVNTITGLGTVFIKEAFITRIVKLLYRLTQGDARKVFFQNNDDKSLFIKERLVTTENVDVIAAGSGVDLNFFHYSELTGNDNKAVTFLLVSRMLWDKGIGEYVDAARQIKAVYPATRFQLLGFIDVLNRTAISKTILDAWVDEDIIEYLGSTPDVRLFIEKCDCVVLPSYREGKSRSLIEAASMGRPLIATNVTGCREVVDNGVNGYLCAPKDASDLADKLDAYIKLPVNDRMAMSRASRKKAEELFDEKIVISKYMGLIDKLG